MLSERRMSGMARGLGTVCRLAVGAMSPARLTFCALLSCGTLAVADDTEIFRATYDGEATNSRPKVLIVFDDSGSMDTTVAGSKPAYDPGTTYAAVGDVKSGRLYWATGNDGKPPAKAPAQYGNDAKNG